MIRDLSTAREIIARQAETIEFYADPRHWFGVPRRTRNGIEFSDIDRQEIGHVGGKRARITLAVVRELLEKKE